MVGGGATPIADKAVSIRSRRRSVLDGALPLTKIAQVSPSGRRRTIDRAFSTVPVCPQVPSAQTRKPNPYHWPLEYATPGRGATI